MHLRSALLAAVAAIPPFAQAQAQDQGRNPPTPLDPVVVTATRTEVRESDTLASVTVIGREDIERAQVNDAAELLRFVAGVEVARAGGPGQFAAAFIRGGNSQHTLVLLDGVRINPTTQGAALQNVGTDLIERIEIVRGPRSTLYGSDAMGGVVHIITRRRGGTTAALQTRYGSYGTLEVAGGGAFGTDTAGLRLHAAQLDSRGFAPHRDSTAERGHRNTTLDAHGDLQFGPVRLDAGAWNAQGKSEYLEDADPFCFPCRYTSPAALDFHNRALAAGAGWSPLEPLESKLTLEQTLDELRIVEGIYTGTHTRNERTQARWQNDWRPADWTRLSLGLERAHERTEAGGVTEVRDADAVYLADELIAGAHRGLLAGSVLDHEAFGSVALWNAEYGYELPTGTRLSVGAGTGFRAPNVIERFFPGFGNPGLRPERARSYEAGVRQHLGQALRVELRVFRTDYDDLIAFDPSTFLAGNVSRARNDGVELSGRWQAADRVSVRLSGVVQDPRSCEPDCDRGARLVRRAAKSAALQLAAGWGPADLSLDALAAGPRSDFDSGTFAPARLPGYGLVNVAGGAALHRRWSLRAKVENLFDKEYETVEGYRQVRRAAYLTLRYSLL